jgi:NADH-quinone oxidoreductase subunit E
MSFHPKMTYGSEQHRSARKLVPEGEPFLYTDEHRARLEQICQRYPSDQRRSAILPALHLVQAQQGYITGHAMRHVAEVIGCAPAEVEDVVSFYTMFHTGPVGTYVLQVCGTLSCALLGAERVVEELTAALGVGVGGTDPTRTFTLRVVECLGACDRAPLVMVNDEWHERQRPERIGELLDALRARGLSAVSGCHLKVAEER